MQKGSPILPVNCRGIGQEFAMLSTNIHEGGMLDGQLRHVLIFSDDEHPKLAFDVWTSLGKQPVRLWCGT